MKSMRSFEILTNISCCTLDKSIFSLSPTVHSVHMVYAKFIINIRIKLHLCKFNWTHEHFQQVLIYLLGDYRIAYVNSARFGSMLMKQLLIGPYKIERGNPILFSEIESINSKYGRMPTLQIKLEMPMATQIQMGVLFLFLCLLCLLHNPLRRNAHLLYRWRHTLRLSRNVYCTIQTCFVSHICIYLISYPNNVHTIGILKVSVNNIFTVTKAK